MQMTSSACEVEGGRLSGLPFDSTGTLDGDHTGQQSAPYLTRGLRNPACRLITTAVLLGATLAHQHSATIVITTKIIWSMLSSSSRLAVPRLHSCLSPASGAHREDGPLRMEGPIYLSEKRRGCCGATQTGRRSRPPYICCSHVASSYHHFVYFCWIWPSRLRAQRKPVPWVCSANPPRPRAVAVMSETGLCQDPPRIDRTTPFISGPCGFRSGACW